MPHLVLELHVLDDESEFAYAIREGVVRVDEIDDFSCEQCGTDCGLVEGDEFVPFVVVIDREGGDTWLVCDDCSFAVVDPQSET